MTHTPEKWYVGYDQEYDIDAGNDGRTIGYPTGRDKFDGTIFMVAGEDQIEIIAEHIRDERTAHRIAALWNMAEELGLTTEAIEKGVIQDSYHALADHLVEEIVSGKIQRLEAEKAEMLAILEELRESSTCCGTYDLLEETTWASPDLADRIESAIQKARGEE